MLTPTNTKLHPLLTPTQAGMPYTNTHKHKTLYFKYIRTFIRAVASGPAGPTLVGPLFGSKMRECLDDSYARAYALTVAAVFHSVDRGMDSSFTVIATQKFADIPERPLSL